MVKTDLALARTRTNGFASATEAWLNHRSVFVIGLLAALLGLVKAGLDGFETELFPPESWPEPLSTYPFFSYGARAIAFFGGFESSTHYAAMGLALIAATIALTALTISRVVNGPGGRLAVLVILGGPIVWVMAGRVGHPDAFAILGGILLGAMGRNVYAAAVGAFVASLGSPEQGSAIALSLLIVSLTSQFRAWRSGALVALAISLAIWAGLSMWAHDLGHPSRLEILPALLGLSLERFFLHFPVILYSGLGLALPVVLIAVLNSPRWQAVAVIVGALGVPLAMTAVTMDQSRILATVTTASTTAIIVIYASEIAQVLRSTLHYPLTLIVGLLFFMPAIDVTGNVIREPWSWYFPYIQVYVIDRIPLM